MPENLFPTILHAPKFIPIVSDSGIGAESGQCYEVQDKSERYKLRVCSSEEKAAKIEKMLRLVPEFIPKFEGRRGSHILMEHVEGRDMRHHESYEHIERLGALIAGIHSVPYDSGIDFEARFMERLDYLRSRGIVDEGLAKKADASYTGLKPESLEAGIVYSDILWHNFRITPEGRVMVIDEESFQPDIKGGRLPKAMCKWLDAGQREAFTKGYNSAADLSFYLQNEQFMQVYFAVSWIFNKVCGGKDTGKAVALLAKSCQEPSKP